MTLNIYFLNLANTSHNIDEKIIRLIPNQIKKKIQQYHFEKDKFRALLSELLIRNVLAEELSTSSKSIKILFNKYNKPYLSGQERNFNLSHSKDLIVLATDKDLIGIDIEYIENLNDLESLISYFSPEEQKALLAKKKEEQLKTFYNFWTLKESYIKALGKGLTCPLKSFTINILDNSITLKASVNSINSWHFKTYDIFENYKCSVCAQHKNFPEHFIKKNVADLVDLYL